MRPNQGSRKEGYPLVSLVGYLMASVNLLISSLRSTFILLSPFTSPIPPILASQTGRRREPEGSAERGSRPACGARGVG